MAERSAKLSSWGRSRIVDELELGFLKGVKCEFSSGFISVQGLVIVDVMEFVTVLRWVWVVQ